MAFAEKNAAYSPQQEKKIVAMVRYVSNTVTAVWALNLTYLLNRDV